MSLAQYVMAYFIFLFIAALAVVRAGFGQGTGPVYLSNVGCAGTESSLLSCSHSGIGITSCSHYSDAGVVCPSCKLVNVQASAQTRSCHCMLFLHVASEDFSSHLDCVKYTLESSAGCAK